MMIFSEIWCKLVEFSGKIVFLTKNLTKINKKPCRRFGGISRWPLGPLCANKWWPGLVFLDAWPLKIMLVLVGSTNKNKVDKSISCWRKRAK